MNLFRNYEEEFIVAIQSINKKIENIALATNRTALSLRKKGTGFQRHPSRSHRVLKAYKTDVNLNCFDDP